MVQLIITMSDVGQVQVTGPLENRVLCYGLLEIARDVIYDKSKKAESNIIQPVLAVKNRGN